MKKLSYLVIFLSFFSLRTFGQCITSISFSYSQGPNGTDTFTSIVTGGTGPFQYKWDFRNDSMVSTLPNPVFTFPANYTYNVCLSVHDAPACPDTLICLPVIVTNSQNVACTGSAGFTVSQSGSQTEFNFNTTTSRNIDFGDGYSDQCYCNQIQHQYKLNGSYTVTSVTYSVLSGFVIYCDTFTQVINVTNVPCHADFDILTDSGFSGGSAGHFYFTNQSTGGIQNKWYLNGNIISTDTNDVYTQLLPPGTYNICLVINGPNGCTDSICKIDSLVYTPVCQGVSFNYSAVSNACDAYQFATTNNSGSSLSSFEWDEDGSMVSTQQNPLITLNFASAQNNIAEHTITVTAIGNGCKSSASFIFDNPAGFSVFIADSTSNPHVWKIYPTTTSNIISETWDFGDGTTSTDPYPTHTYASVGTYNVCHEVTLSSGCSYNYCYSQYFFRQEQGNAVIEVEVMSPTAVKIVVNNELDISVYPNPATDEFNIVCGKVFEPNTTFSLTNSLGQDISTLAIAAESKSLTISVKQLPAGLYYFRITNLNSILQRGKLVVVK